ncbi:hypothetical protein, partial [Nonomuraea africana]|uniref:hypothetical protein n=1 Tax=Nonomuraea africana TaxID=46171 RepID=UPI0031D35B77
QTLDHPLESRFERLRHHLRRPPEPDHPITNQDRDTPLTGHTPAELRQSGMSGRILSPVADRKTILL